MKMWCSVLVIFASFYIFNAQETDVAEVVINFYRDRSGDLQCKGNAPVLVVNSPFRVYINYTENIYRARCFRSSDNSENLFNRLSKEPPQIRLGYLSEKNAISRRGQSSYTCHFYTKNCGDDHQYNCYYFDSYRLSYYQDLGVQCSFEIQVLKPEDVSVKLTGHLTANSAVFYSGTHNYYFYDGEPTDFICYKTNGGYVQISYTSKAGDLISTEYQATSSVGVFMKLTATDADGTVLECSISDEIFQHQLVIRLCFVYYKNEKGLGFKVNGLMLPALSQNDNKEFFYAYKYYAGEDLTVEVVKDDSLYEGVVCSVEGRNVPYNLKTYFNNTAQAITGPIKVIFYEGQTNVVICCTVRVINQKNHLYINVTFTYHAPDYHPFIQGLSMANILVMYSTRTTNVIQYDYVGNETLLLSCMPVNSNQETKWRYSNQAVLTPDNPNYIKNRPFLLQPSRSKAVIRCVVGASPTDRNTTLEVIRRKDVNDSTSSPVTPVFPTPHLIITLPTSTKIPLPTKPPSTSSVPKVTKETDLETTTLKAEGTGNGQPKEKPENPVQETTPGYGDHPEQGTQKGNVGGSGSEVGHDGDATPPQGNRSELLPKDAAVTPEQPPPLNKTVELDLKPHQNERETKPNSTQVELQGNLEGPKEEPKQNYTETAQESAKNNVEDTVKQPMGSAVDSGQRTSKNYPMNPTQEQTKSDLTTEKPMNKVTTKKPGNKRTTKKPRWRTTKKPSGRTTKKYAWQNTKKTTKPRMTKPTQPPTTKPTTRFTTKPTQPFTVIPTLASTTKPTENSTEKLAESVSTTEMLMIANSTEFVAFSGGVLDSAVVKASSPSELMSGSKFGIIAAAVAVVLVILSAVLWIAVDLKKRKQRIRHNPTDIDYQNLPQHNEGTMQTPPQWDSNDGTYAVPDTKSLENLYSKPVPKSRRNTKIVEPMYSQTTNVKNIEPAYASVQNEPTYASVQNDGPTYASVQKTDGPTYASAQNDGPTYASVQKDCPTYASVQNDGPTYASVQKDGPTYASVQKTQDPTYAEAGKNEYQNLAGMAKLESELTYADIYKSDRRSSKVKPAISAKPHLGQLAKKPEQQKYANIEEIKRQHDKLAGRYANVDAKKEEVEPAYCEVNVKKRS